MNTTHLRSRYCSEHGLIRKWLIGRKLRKLKLDNSQIDKLDELFAGLRSTTEACFVANIELQQHITELLTEDGFNHDKAANLIHSVADQHTERATEIAVRFGEFYQGLESWQQQQLRAMWQKRRRCASRCCH